MEDDFITRGETQVIRSIGRERINKICIYIMSLLPPLMAFAMLVHCFNLLIGHPGMIAETTCQCSVVGFIALMALSYYFRFCWVQRSLMIYAFTVGICIDVQHYIGFGHYLFAARFLMFLVGLTLFVLFFHLKAWRTCARREKLRAWGGIKGIADNFSAIHLRIIYHHSVY